ncbi:MAG: ATP-binding protein [Balneolales bacterium]
MIPEEANEKLFSGKNSVIAIFIAGFFAFLFITPLYSASQDQRPADYIKNHLLKPPMQIFEPRNDYDGEGQNWGSLELENGLILIANERGIFQYDGREFTRIIELNNPVRDFTVDEGGQIYVSGMKLFGRLHIDKMGVWNFEDLWDSLPEVQGNNVAWNIEALDGHVYIRFSYGVIRYHDGEGQLLTPGEEEYGAGDFVRSDERLFIVINNQDLYEIVDGELQFAYTLRDIPSNNGKALGKETDDTGKPRNKILINYYKDFFEFDPETYDILQIETSDVLSEFIGKHHAYSAIILNNGYLAVGSITGGLLVVDEELNQVLRLTSDDGLLSNTILNLHEDREGGLWLLTGHGLARLDFYYPYWKSIRNQHIKGDVYSLKAYRDQWIIGTNESAYIIKKDGITTPDDDKNIASVWDMETFVMPGGIEHFIAIDNVALAAFANNGFYTIEKNTGNDYRSGEIWDLLFHPGHPGWLFGTENGRVFRVRLDYNNDGKLEIREYDILYESAGIYRDLRFDNEGSLWFEEGSGQVIRLYFESGISGFFDDSPEPYQQNFSDGSDENVPEFVSYAHNQDDFYLLAIEGDKLYQIKPERRSGTTAYTSDDFTHKDLDFPVQRLITPVDYGDEVLYTTYVDSIGRLQKDGTLINETLFNIYGEYITYGHFDGKDFFLAGSEGVIGYREELEPYHEINIPYNAVITSVHIQNDSLIRGPAIPVDATPLSLDYANNQFRFTFSPGSVIFGGAKAEYQTQLEPFDEQWSPWSGRHIREFTSLPPGDYNFRARARNPYGNISEPATYSFSIIPPWYQTWWAWILFFAGFMAIMGFSVNRYLAYRKKISMQRMLAEQAEKLEKLDRMRTNLFMNISHELRTPLTLVLGQIEQFRNISEKLGSDWERRYDIARRNGDRLHQLVEQVLDLTRLDSHQMHLKIEKFELGSFLRRTLESFESMTDRKNIFLLSHIPERQIFFVGDMDKIEKMIINLISNAIKFTPPKGTITLTLNESEDDVEIIITDTGTGIQEDRLPFIFDRFHSTGESLAGGGHGLGIGLSITREFIELHDGSISVTSEPGSGTTFTLHLPLKDEDHLVPDDKPEVSDILTQKKEISRSIGAVNGHSRKKVTILIVEDNDDMRSYISDVLSSEALRIETAENGIEGKKKLSITKPDLIISDIMMPEMDGFKFTEYVRSVPEYRQTPIILLSARAEIEDRIHGYQIGITDYLVKPFHEQELVARIANLIKFKAERENQSTGNAETEEVFSHERAFVNKLKDYVESNITKTEISTELLSEAMNISRRQLYRRLNKATGFTPASFVREIRFDRALYLLEHKQKQTVAEVAFAVGFSNPSHFSKLFKERFGALPSKYLSN